MSENSNARTEIATLITGVAGTSHWKVEDSLFEDGLGLDSMGFLKLVLAAEDMTGRDLRANLDDDSIRSVGAFITHIADAISD